MPNVNWGISTGDVENFDRDAQFTPYRGKIPPNAVYVWKLYRLQYAAGTETKHPQLRIGVELVPQDKSEKAYKGYRIMSFRSVMEKTQFAYVPLLDALGVSANDFISKTRADSEGNIQRIGAWKNTGEQLICALLKDDKDQDGKARKDIGWIGALEDDAEDDELDPLDDDDEEYADDDDEYDDDEEYDDE